MMLNHKSTRVLCVTKASESRSDVIGFDFSSVQPVFQETYGDGSEDSYVKVKEIE